MSLNVLVIPEDFRKDQYILGPLVRKMLSESGKPRANVVVCQDPLLGGIDQATDWKKIEEVIEMYPMVKLFLLLVDRDGVAGRRTGLNALEGKATTKLGAGRMFIAENAWQEIEVWALAGQDLPQNWNWQEIRAELHPKESYFEPLAAQRGLKDEPGEGRTTMGRDAANQYARVRSRCREDIQVLEDRIKYWCEGN